MSAGYTFEELTSRVVGVLWVVGCDQCAWTRFGGTEAEMIEAGEQHIVEHAPDYVDELRARITNLRAALAPFAELLDLHDDYGAITLMPTHVRVADVRRAAFLLETEDT